MSAHSRCLELHPEGADESGRLVVASITHLDFDPLLPRAREIAADNKHRIQRLKRAQQTQPARLG